MNFMTVFDDFIIYIHTSHLITLNTISLVLYSAKMNTHKIAFTSSST